MADEVDLTQEREERVMELMRNQRRLVELTPTGACHYCGEDVDYPKKFCDFNCAEDYEYTKRMTRR